MQTRTLDPRERLAIESILEDAERSYLKGSIAQNIEALDQQCKSIWSDWEDSVQPRRTSPDRQRLLLSRALHNSPVKRSHIASPSVSASTSETETETATEHRSQTSREETPHPVSDSDSRSKSDSDASTGSEAPTNPIRARRQAVPAHRAPPPPPPRASQKSSRRVPKKHAQGPVQPFSRADAARLRQDNLELKAQVTRLQAALDRANMENAKLKEELQRYKQDKQKQKSVIAFLKEDRLYGKKKM